MEHINWTALRLLYFLPHRLGFAFAVIPLSLGWPRPKWHQVKIRLWPDSLRRPAQYAREGGPPKGDSPLASATGPAKSGKRGRTSDFQVMSLMPYRLAIPLCPFSCRNPSELFPVPETVRAIRYLM